VDTAPTSNGALRRREVVADLSKRALDTDDADELLDAAAAAVADCLDAAGCGVFEYRSDDEAVLRAGAGWPGSVVGDGRISAASDSTVGRALRAAEPVALEDAGSNESLRVPAPLPDAEATSTLGAPIAVDGEPWGVLELRTTEQRSFEEEETAFVVEVADVLGSALSNHLSESDLEEVYGRISDAFFGLDEEWRFTYLNERAHELINPDGEALVGENVWEQFPEAIGRQFKPKYEHAMYEQEAVTFEEYYPEPLNAWFEVSAYPSETGLSVYFQDVTDRKEMERELRRSEARFRMLADELDEVVWMATADGEEFVYVNPAFEEIWGMAVETLYDEPMAFVDAVHPEDRERVREAFRSLPEEPYDEEFRIVRPDGEVRWIHARGTLATAGEVAEERWLAASHREAEEDGEMERIIGIGEDVTEHKHREERLEELVDELEASNERLEQFAYAASHDLQEPLRMVSSYLQLIEDRYGDELDEEGEEFIDYAVDGADRMREMIRGLLEYSRVETRGDPFEPVDLNEVVDDVRQDLEVRIEESDAEIDVDDLPRVVGDAGQLGQVFQNLLDNAIEYSGDTSPAIEITAERADEMWAITVSDEGVGIDPDDAERVFEVFERLHGLEKHSGTGIGLALCDRIVERHGGDIWVDSEPGEGASFTFTLPAADRAD
jgi:PAS domain S-box-containing protein